MSDQSANLIAVMDAHAAERASLLTQIDTLTTQLNARADFLSPDAVVALAREATLINGVTIAGPIHPQSGTGAIHPLDTV